MLDIIFPPNREIAKIIISSHRAKIKKLKPFILINFI